MNRIIKYFDKLYCQGEKDFYSLVDNNLKNNEKMFIVTSNPETFTYGEKLDNFNNLLIDEKTTLIPDGVGIVKSANMLGYKVTERITGIDLAVHLINVCNVNKYKLCLLGAKAEVMDKLKEIIKRDYPNINLGICENGYIEDKDAFLEKVKIDKPDVFLVALGIPKQEELIYKHLDGFDKGIFVGVGGSFDVLSGTKKRAPKIFQKLNIEWLYRIIKEPKRLKRFYDNNIKFILKIKKYKK